MTIPNSNVAIQDGGLGLSPEIATNVVAFLGCAATGNNNEVLTFGGGNPNAIAQEYTAGPMPEAACLANARGVPVICVKVQPSAVGAAGSVTQVGTGTAVLDPSSSSPNDSYHVIAAVVQAGASPTAGSATFRYSLDGGVTYSDEIALPVNGSYTVQSTGLILNFGSSGTLVAGDTYAFTCTSPVFTSTQLNTALTALLADPDLEFLASVIGVPADSTTMLGFFSAIEAKLDAAAANNRFLRGKMSAYDGSDAALKTSALSMAGLRTGVGAGFGVVTSSISGVQFRRPVGHWITVAKLGAIQPQIDAAEFDLGAEPEVVSLERDEEATPGLDAARYSTMRTFAGNPGFYITNARLMSPPTSDFRYYQFGRVMDIAAAVVRTAGLRELNKTILVDAKTGRISDKAAAAINARVTAALQAETSQKGRVSAATAQVDQTNDVLTTEEININYSLVPLAYAKQVNGTISFRNPAISTQP